MARVLFISDNQEKIRIVQELLSANSVDIEIAQEENEIFDKITAFYPDLILLDTQLSVSDITILAKKLK